MVRIISKKCPECGSTSLEWTENGLICKNCGLVLSEAFQSGTILI